MIMWTGKCQVAYLQCTVSCKFRKENVELIGTNFVNDCLLLVVATDNGMICGCNLLAKD